MSGDLEALIIRRTFRLPEVEGPAGDGAVAARQFDAVLMSLGFKLSGELFARLSGLAAGSVIDTAVRVLPIMRRLVGAHVEHNVYFRDFPKNVPDTLEFWTECLRGILDVGDVLIRPVNLLALPTYGSYQHDYAEMVAAHDELIASAGDRVTMLHAGAVLAEEVSALYLSMASSVTPLSEEDVAVLRELALHCATGPQPTFIPVREHRAILNEVRLAAGADLLVDTVTDVLRLACLLSEGDVSLRERTRFRSFRRPVRRALLAALDAVVDENPAKLGDVGAYREPWKRLGERLHPHEYPRFICAAEVFAVARGEVRVPSFASRVERLLADGDVAGAATVLRSAPGLLFRSLDHLLRNAFGDAEQQEVLLALDSVITEVSGRVLLSVREHLDNRGTGARRIFAHRSGRGLSIPDMRYPIEAEVLDLVRQLIDAEITRRLPVGLRVVVDPDIVEVALPLSGKGISGGFGMLPRGSIAPVTADLLRFFVYWKERAERTDFDLSAVLLDRDFGACGWLSYTNLTELGGTHSGDITSAPDGASEFIDIRLDLVRAEMVLPQVNVYSGEGFEEVLESFFGYMARDAYQRGQPFEPTTVRAKSELRGAGRIALPLVFIRAADGWRVKWLHLYLSGSPNFNRVESNHVATSALARAVVERDYLHIGYLAGLLSADNEVTLWDGGPVTEPVTFIGLARPEGLPAGSQVITPENLSDVIPA
ncbi:hypothetical protein AB0L82_40210 [Nocardia sp. NPDC052001]|uniref:hypothetical protein n=1 Tax=Nocardia sp. NPDC052001 TaxID=3154853 RepID=UPI00343EC979